MKATAAGKTSFRAVKTQVPNESAGQDRMDLLLFHAMKHKPARLERPLLAILLTTLVSLVLAGCQTETRSVSTAPYSEPHRLQYHFSQPANWMNDPNGMVYYAGEYHLFYQYYPEDTVWGPMHWAHAVSTDMVHWENLPVALYPDDLGYIFSGSAVVDWSNTSGFGTGGQPPLVAIFTYHDPEKAKAETHDHETQGIAYSNDKGRSWTKYAGNPVIANTEKQNDFRDPKVFWHAPSGKWVMVLSAGDHMELWGSPNLKDWHHLSDFGRGLGAQGGVWECPDLIHLPLAGTGESRWVLIQNINPGGPHGGSGTQYFVGQFDGTRFTLDPSFAEDLREEGAVWLDQGRDNYAGVTWADVPEEDGRTLFIGWMGNWDYAQEVPTHPWRSAMTLPRKLTLHRTPEGLRVFSQPVEELQQLRVVEREIAPMTVPEGDPVRVALAFPAFQCELLVRFKLPASGSTDFGLEVSNSKGERYRIGYSATTGEFYSDRTQAGDASFSETFARVHRTPRISEGEVIELHLFFDRASCELFADGGANVMTDTYFPSEDFDQLRFYSNGGSVEVVGGQAWPLKGIW